MKNTELKNILKSIRSEFNSLPNISLSEYKNELEYREYGEDDYIHAIPVLETSISAVDGDVNDYGLNELLDLLEELINGDDDFNLDLSGGCVRIIDTMSLDGIWTDSLIDLVKEIYFDSEIPKGLVIDWEATAEKGKVDGAGHHFAGYDGQEHISGNKHIFRTA